MNDDARILALVNDFIQQTRTLIYLMQEDAEYFKTNDLLSLEDNAVKKAQANDRIIAVVAHLSQMPALLASQGNLYEKLLQHVACMPMPQRDELDVLLYSLYDELARYSQLMTINRHLINANMAYIKDIFFAIVNHKVKEEAQPVYDRLGLLEQV